MRTKHLFAVASLLGMAVSSLASQQLNPSALPSATVTSANDGVFAAFRTHSVVGLGDIHWLAQEEGFFSQLIADPRFAKEVGNVVVEFGDAAEQEMIDRYVAGEDVPYQQLRRMWADKTTLPPSNAAGVLSAALQKHLPV